MLEPVQEDFSVTPPPSPSTNELSADYKLGIRKVEREIGSPMKGRVQSLLAKRGSSIDSKLK